MKTLPISLTFLLLTSSYPFAENYGRTFTRITLYKTRQGFSCNMKIQRNKTELKLLLAFCFYILLLPQEAYWTQKSKKLHTSSISQKYLTATGTSNVKTSIKKTNVILQIEINIFLTYFLYHIFNLQYWPLLSFTVEIKILECKLFIFSRHR